MKRTRSGGSAGKSPHDAATSTAPANDAPTGGAGGGADPGPGFAPDSYASAGNLAIGGAELLEDRSSRLATSSDGDGRRDGSRRGRGRRTWLSGSGAIVGTFLVAALALGAVAGPLGLTGDRGHDGDGHGVALAEPTQDATDGLVDGATDGSGTDGAIDGDGATDAPDGVDAPDATQGPVDGTGPDGADAPATTEAPAAPGPTAIEIGIGIDNIYPAIEWSRCATDGFVAYKVIRSTNEGVTWPLGSGDSVVGVLTEIGAGRFVDRTVKPGTTYHYRVIALRTWNGEKVLACESRVRAITTPVADPTNPPVDGPGLTVTLSDGGHPVVDWTACTGVTFTYYKVVRSTDATVTWPAGENDSLVAAVGPDGQTITTDTGAPGGSKLYYRVFCVRSTESGYVTVASSDVRAIETPAVQPAPDPVSLGLEVTVGGDGVALTWQQCTSDAFHWYKIVRSTTTTNPSYLPSTDGTQLIGVIESAATTHFVDGAAPSGQTAYYRVQCLGYWNGQVVLLGQTAAIAVALP